MAARKKQKAQKKNQNQKTKKLENGGKRPGAGRKPVEAHFDALTARLKTLENGISAILQHVLPANMATKTQYDPRVTAPVLAAVDERQQALPLYVPEPDEANGTTSLA